MRCIKVNGAVCNVSTRFVCCTSKQVFTRIALSKRGKEGRIKECDRLCVFDELPMALRLCSITTGGPIYEKNGHQLKAT